MLDANGVEIVEPVVPVAVPPVVPEVIVPVIPAAAPVVVPKPEPTGNAFFDAAQDTLHEKGIAPEKYFDEMATAGALTPASRAELVSALGEPQVRMLEQGAGHELSKVRAGQVVETQKVYDAAVLPGSTDGKASFETIAAWAKGSLNYEDRNTYNEMLSKGGTQAKLAVISLKEKYMSDPAFSAANLTTGDGVPAAGGVELISRSTYTAELRKAENARDRVAVAKLNERANYTMKNNAAAWRP